MIMKVVHWKKDLYDVYIGRPSKWGNPYSHQEGTLAEYKTETRQEAIEAYRAYILTGKGNHLLEDLDELEGKTLGGWCKPQSCHGDILIDIIQKRKQIKLF